MGNSMTQKARDDQITLSVADVKDRTRLAQEVEGFATTLLRTAAAHESTKGDLVLTFTRESGVKLALTLHQLVAVVRTMEKN